MQIEDEVQGLIYHTPLSSVAVYGGVPMDPQERALEAGVDIVVATPGPADGSHAHRRCERRSLRRLEILVLDEADRMMDMGFWPDVRRIVAALPARRPPDDALLGDDAAGDARAGARDYRATRRYVQVGSAGAPAKTITHTVQQRVVVGEKAQWLIRFLEEAGGPVLVFARTKIGAERLGAAAAGGWDSGARRCTPIERSSSARPPSRDSGRARIRVLVATDVAARGLDVDGIAHVVNYEVPDATWTPTSTAWAGRAAPRPAGTR